MKVPSRDSNIPPCVPGGHCIGDAGITLKGGKRVSKHDEHDPHYHEDVKILHSMGYAQELSRRMGGFQNFAISFSIICILAGGITAFPLSLSAAGGASLGIG